MRLRHVASPMPQLRGARVGGTAVGAGVTRLVILRGLDGGGMPLEAFVAALGEVSGHIIRYRGERVLDDGQLLGAIAPQLPTGGPYFVLGESFGGPLALALAAADRARVEGVILCASFTRHPCGPLRALAGLARWVPVRRLPLPVLSWVLLGRWSTPTLRAELARAIGSVAPRVLRARVQAALRVEADATLSSLDVPILYLQAAHDRVVAAAAARRIAAVARRACVKQVAGPHFLLQVAPAACAREVRRFIHDHSPPEADH